MGSVDGAGTNTQGQHEQEHPGDLSYCRKLPLVPHPPLFLSKGTRDDTHRQPRIWIKSVGSLLLIRGHLGARLAGRGSAESTRVPHLTTPHQRPCVKHTGGMQRLHWYDTNGVWIILWTNVSNLAYISTLRTVRIVPETPFKTGGWGGGMAHRNIRAMGVPSSSAVRHLTHHAQAFWLLEASRTGMHRRHQEANNRGRHSSRQQDSRNAHSLTWGKFPRRTVRHGATRESLCQRARWLSSCVCLLPSSCPDSTPELSKKTRRLFKPKASECSEREGISRREIDCPLSSGHYQTTSTRTKPEEGWCYLTSKYAGFQRQRAMSYRHRH